MVAASDPNLIVGGFGLGLLVLAGLWRLIGWVRDAPQTPDPWDAEIEQKLQEPEAQEICHHCFAPQPPTAWFCARCGSAVGPYNNLMPYVQVFSEGEVFRNGTRGQFRNRPVIFIGYFLISLTMFWFLAPVYWFSLLRNWKRSAAEPEPAGEQHVQP